MLRYIFATIQTINFIREISLKKYFADNNIQNIMFLNVFIIISISIPLKEMKQENSGSNSKKSKKNKQHKDSMDKNQIQQNIPATTIPNQISYPAGLPNIGNTCFLNSVLQFLYSAEHFRNALIEYHKNEKNKSNTTVVLMAKVFLFLQKNDEVKINYEQISQTLKQFVQLLQQINLDYKRYHQQDAFQTMMNILISIDKGTKFPLKQFFTIKTSQVCQCRPQQVIKKQQFFCPLIQPTCLTCNNKFTVTNLKTPKYLIIVDNTGKTYLKKNSSFMIHKYEQLVKDYSQKHLNKIQTELLSIIKYEGDKKSGHYKCVKQIDQAYYCFNDSKVNKMEKYLPSENDCQCFSFIQNWLKKRFASKEMVRVLLIENKTKVKCTEQYLSNNEFQCQRDLVKYQRGEQ